VARVDRVILMEVDGASRLGTADAAVTADGGLPGRRRGRFHLAPRSAKESTNAGVRESRQGEKGEGGDKAVRKLRGAEINTKDCRTVSEERTVTTEERWAGTGETGKPTITTHDDGSLVARLTQPLSPQLAMVLDPMRADT
jgi:hypothetical protein